MPKADYTKRVGQYNNAEKVDVIGNYINIPSPAITAKYLYDGHHITFGCTNPSSNVLRKLILNSITEIAGEEEIKANINVGLVKEYVKNQVKVCNGLKSQLEESLNINQEALIASADVDPENLSGSGGPKDAIAEQLKPILVEIYNMRIQIALLGNDFFSDTYTSLYAGDKIDLVKGIDICLGRDAVIEQHDSSYKGLVYYVTMIELNNDKDDPFYELNTDDLAEKRVTAKKFMETKASRGVLALDTDEDTFFSSLGMEKTLSVEDKRLNDIFSADVAGGGRINRKKKRINRTKKKRGSKKVKKKSTNRTKKKRGSKKVNKKKK